MAKLVGKPLEICSEHFLLKIQTEDVISKPGQFINIKASDKTDPLLRRPFSIFNQYDDILEIVIRVVGKGTELISKFEGGEIDILAPLGNGFSIPENQNLLLVGGGVGNAPLLYLAKELKKANNRITYIYGARSKEFIYLKERYSDNCKNLIIVTDDGTEGEKGFTTDIAKKLLTENSFDKIYTCGPTVMMKGMVEMTDSSTDIETSVENYFGCGVGLCVGCTIETDQGFQKACKDGPVFDGKIINWDSME